jgi:hypothetical protein
MTSKYKKTKYVIELEATELKIKNFETQLAILLAAFIAFGLGLNPYINTKGGIKHIDINSENIKYMIRKQGFEI